MVDGVADAALQGAHRFFLGLAFGLFAEVVHASGGVVADLGDGGDVSRVVQLSVAAGVESTRFPRRSTFHRLERWQTSYLPIFALWAATVIVTLPRLFAFT